MRKTPFVNGEFYHIYNQGAYKQNVFFKNYDFERFLQSLEEFNTVRPIGSIYANSFFDEKIKLRRRTTKLVKIVCYCLNLNHYHFILQQIVDGGISEFMKRLGGYTRYINEKYKRNGVLFQGKFKSKHINSNEYLLHLSAYVNLNNFVHKIKGCMFRSSWEEYVQNNGEKCEKEIILNKFKNKKEYKEFAESSLKDIIERKQLFKELEGFFLSKST